MNWIKEIIMGRRPKVAGKAPEKKAEKELDVTKSPVLCKAGCDIEAVKQGYCGKCARDLNI